jgi:hypothetical protein
MSLLRLEIKKRVTKVYDWKGGMPKTSHASLEHVVAAVATMVKSE